MSRCPHSHFPTGAHVFVIMRSGEKFEDKWLPYDSDGWIKLEKRGVMRLRGVRCITYRKLRDTAHGRREEASRATGD